MERESFTVDLADPDDIRHKYEQAKQILNDYEMRLAELREVERLVEEWRDNVTFLGSKLRIREPASEPANPPTHRARPGASVADLVVDVVNRETRKIRSIDVCELLLAEGREVSAQSVSNALHYAAHKAGKIKPAVGRGMYAPLSYEEPNASSSDGDAANLAPDQSLSPVAASPA